MTNADRPVQAPGSPPNCRSSGVEPSDRWRGIGADLRWVLVVLMVLAGAAAVLTAIVITSLADSVDSHGVATAAMACGAAATVLLWTAATFIAAATCRQCLVDGVGLVVVRCAYLPLAIVGVGVIQVTLYRLVNGWPVTLATDAAILVAGLFLIAFVRRLQHPSSAADRATQVSADGPVRTGNPTLHLRTIALVVAAVAAVAGATVVVRVAVSGGTSGVILPGAYQTWSTPPSAGPTAKTPALPGTLIIEQGDYSYTALGATGTGFQSYPEGPLQIAVGTTILVILGGPWVDPISADRHLIKQIHANAHDQNGDDVVTFTAFSPGSTKIESPVKCPRIRTLPCYGPVDVGVTIS